MESRIVNEARNTMQLIDAQCRHMLTYIWFDIGASGGFLPDDTKPLPESI